MGMPWLVTRNDPHFSQASLIRLTASGLARSMMGNGSSRDGLTGWLSGLSKGKVEVHARESGNSETSLKSIGLKVWDDGSEFIDMVGFICKDTSSGDAGF